MLGTLRIARARAAVAEASAALADLSESVHAVGNTELEVFFGEVDDLSRQLEAARVAILGQALSRGVVAQSDRANPTSWVIGCAPSYRAGGAAQLVRVTRATQAVRNTGLAGAVLGARVGVRNAAVALTQMDKLRPRLKDEAVATVWAGFLADRHRPRPGPDPRAAGQADRHLRARRGSSNAARTSSRTRSASPSRSMTTGSPSTGCAWTPRARKSSRPSSARCPRPDPPRPAPTCAPATNAAARPWSRSAGGPPQPAGPPRPRPRPRYSSPSACKTSRPAARPG